MKKKLITLIIGGFAFWHISATALYLAPVNPLSSSYLPLIQPYMNPLFSQNWNLFAPEPATASLQLWYRCQVDGKWSSWKSPIAGLLREHRSNRFTYRGKLIYVLKSIPRSLLNKKLELKNSSEVEQTNEYKLAKRLSHDLCAQDQYWKNSKSALQFRIVKLLAKNYSQRLEPFSPDQLKSIDFGPVFFNGGKNVSHR